LSARRDRPLTRINCGAIPAGLVESELFGHAKGAFTGAVDQRVGRFELADGGTIFLDEVGELPPETQVKLLRVLQEREFEPIGSDRTLRVDVRVIAATNRDLEEAVRMGRFRSDLFYRLNVIPMRLPPLRERASDIPKLVTHFVDRACRATGRVIERIPGHLMERLESYAWPGNVRELQNLMERAVILSPGLELELEPGLLPLLTPRPPGISAAAQDVLPRASLPTLEESERELILDALRETNGVIDGLRGAARLLDIHPSTLRSRMKKLQIERPDMQRREASDP
jgi:formate hydrogenlyase transcriptional activator